MFKLHRKIRKLASELTDIHDEYKLSARKTSARIDNLSRHLSAQKKDIQRQTGEIGHLKEELAKYRKIHKPKQLALHMGKGDGANNRARLGYIVSIGGSNMLNAVYDCIKHPALPTRKIAVYYNIRDASGLINSNMVIGRLKRLENWARKSHRKELREPLSPKTFRNVIYAYQNSILGALHEWYPVIENGTSSVSRAVADISAKSHIPTSTLYECRFSPRAVKVYNARYHTHHGAEK